MRTSLQLSEAGVDENALSVLQIHTYIHKHMHACMSLTLWLTEAGVDDKDLSVDRR